MKENLSYRRLMLSLLIFTLVPLFALSVSVYLVSSKGLEAQVRKSEMQSLQNYENKIELVLKNIDGISVQQAMVQTNISMADLLTLPVSDIRNILNSNSAALLSNEYINSIYVYEKDQPMIINNSEAVNWDIFKDRGWLKLYQETPGYKNEEASAWLYDRPVTAPDQESASSVVTTLIRPFPIASSDKKGYIVVNVDMAKLLNTFINTGSSVYAVIAPDQKLIFSTDKNLDAKAIDYNKKIIRISGKDQYLFSIYSKTYGFHYVSLVSKASLLAPIQPIKNLIYLILLVGAAIMTILAFLASHLLYNPIQKLVRHIGISSVNSRDQSCSNEFSYIQSSFDCLLEQNKSMGVQLDQNSSLVKESVTLKILRGELQHPSDFDISSLSGIFGKAFAVMSVERYDRRLISDAVFDTAAAPALDILHSFARTVRVEVYNHMTSFILCFNAEDGFEANRQDVLEACRSLYRAEGVPSGVCIAVGVGGAYCSTDDINLSFLQSLTAIKSRLLRSGDPVILSESNPENACATKLPYSVMELELKLISLIKECRSDQIATTIHEMLALASTSKLSPDSAYNWLNHLRDSLISIPDSIGFESHDFPGETYDGLLSEYRTVKNLDQLEEYLSRLSVLIVQGLKSKRSNRNQETIEAVKAYISAHISEDTSLNSVADKFGMSAPYLSNIFKQETGENFLNYVIRMKIEIAKKLLSETQMSVDMISQKIGYYNNHGFYNNFKKLTGLTPNEFRKNARMQGSST